MRASNGFSLLEVMIASAILAISLTTLQMFFGNSLVQSGRSEQLTIASMLARDKMTEVELELQKGMKKNEFPEEKSADGEFDQPYEDFKWKMEIRKVELPAPVAGDKNSMEAVVGQQLTKEISKTVRELKVSITWMEGGEEQSLDVVTHIVKL